MVAAEHVALIATGGALVGVGAYEAGIKTDSTLINVAVGAVVLLAAWYFAKDGISDAGIGIGAGYAVASVI